MARFANPVTAAPGGLGAGSAPTSATQARNSHDGALLTPLEAPDEERGNIFGSGSYVPRSYAATGPMPYGGMGFYGMPMLNAGWGGYPASPMPPEMQQGGGGGGSPLMDLLLLLNSLRRGAGGGADVTGSVGRMLGSLAGPVNTGRSLATLGIAGDSWLGANAAFGAAGSGSLGLIDGAMQATPGLTWGAESGLANTTPGLGLTTPNMQAIGSMAIPAAMLLYGNMSQVREHKKRMEAAERYATAAEGAERTDLGENVSGFGSDDRYYLETPLMNRPGNEGDFGVDKYLDRAIASAPIGTQQYTGSYSSPVAGGGRTATELTGVGDQKSLEQFLRTVVTPTVNFAASAPRAGATDAGQEDHSKWLARELPSVLGGGQRYATHMRTGERMNLEDGQATPLGYDLASNNGFGSDAPPLPTAKSLAGVMSQAQDQEVLGSGGQGGLVVRGRGPGPQGTQGSQGTQGTQKGRGSRVDAFNAYDRSLRGKAGWDKATPKERWESFNKSKAGRR